MKTTETTQHTPGPWRAFEALGDNDHPLDKVWQVNGRHPIPGFQPESDCQLARVYSIEANARLIAAAPEMLAALTAWLACHDAAGNTPLDEAFAEPVRSILKNARLAVAKAWGVE